tara:strand:+ start:826 stop:996 length:171 start_codon:yes stop_codon:yes gene_type:complete
MPDDRKISRDYLLVDNLYKNLNRLLFDRDYAKPELKKAKEVLKELRAELAEKLEKK